MGQDLIKLQTFSVRAHEHVSCTVIRGDPDAKLPAKTLDNTTVREKPMAGYSKDVPGAMKIKLGAEPRDE